MALQVLKCSILIIWKVFMISLGCCQARLFFKSEYFVFDARRNDEYFQFWENYPFNTLNPFP